MLTSIRINKSFGKTKILSDINISIEKGQITCLIGSSGCGKTTLLRSLAFLDLPDSGRIELDENIYQFPIIGKPPYPWPKVTAVFQSLFLWPHLTLMENIMLPARARNPNAQQDISEMIELFDMGGFIDKYPNETSGGQKQRAAIARALILNPDYILLDEITSALDIEQSAKVLRLLLKLREKGIGVLIITHSFQFAKNCADKIAFMDNGKIAEQGTCGILESPKTKALKSFVKSAHDFI